ncbi:MAG: hypothetical protein QM714_10870 [Nocardioides sp.]|uniref:hypothetical protein n=1 Tax=Nocardioides sp. TaxID=35761 RepID=UPI0039E40971
MSAPQQGDPSSTAFDLFDRWMTNREAPAKAPEATPAALDDIVIADTKASREAARARLEAARLEQEDLESTPTTESAAPVLTPVDSASPEPTIESPAVDALVVQPAAQAAAAEQAWGVGAEMPPFELPAYRPPHAAAVPSEDAAPSVPAAPSGGKRRAAVATDSAPVIAAPSEGRRRRQVEPDAAPLVAAKAAAETSTPAAAVIEPVETPTTVEPVAEAAPSVATPPERSWAETLAALAQTETVPKEGTTPPLVESDELRSTGWGSTEDAASKQKARKRDTNAAESTEESDDDARKGLNLRLILNVLAIVAVLGAGAAGYFLFKGSDWALRPTAGLTALGTFLVSARFTV